MSERKTIQRGADLKERGFDYNRPDRNKPAPRLPVPDGGKGSDHSRVGRAFKASPYWCAGCGRGPKGCKCNHGPHGPKDWPEDDRHENGGYECGPCVKCEATFRGHKRRVVCKECSTPFQGTPPLVPAKS